LSGKAFFTLAAKRDLRDARDWYEGERGGLGLEFLGEVQHATRRLESSPEQFAVVHRQMRLCPVKRFPYIIVFRIAGDHVEVLAVIHAHRNSIVWKRRS
jgi:plasmid stabilization system protein ParE